MGMSETARHRVRHDGWTGERQQGFVAALKTAGNVRDACRAVGLSNTSAYRLRRRDRQFAREWDAALAQSATALEAVAYARAVEGVEEPVFHGGQQIGTKRKRSDALLRLLLQGASPEKYGRAGKQPSVQLREEFDARIEEIEQAAYKRAWTAFEAEYRYEYEVYWMRRVVLRLLTQAHERMCGNPFCRECHPERHPKDSEDWEWFTDPGEDHDPIDPETFWIKACRAEVEWERRKAHAEGTRRPAEPRPSYELTCRAPARSLVTWPKPEWTRESVAKDHEAMRRGEPKNRWQRPGWIDPRKEGAKRRKAARR